MRWHSWRAVMGAVLLVALAACGADEDSALVVTDEDDGPAPTAPGTEVGTTTPVPTGPTTTFSPPTDPPFTVTMPVLPSLPPPSAPGGSVETTTTAVPLPDPVTLRDATHLRPLAEPSQEAHVPESPASLCAELVSEGWFVEQCEAVGPVFAVVQRALDDNRLRVQVLSDAATPGAWRAVLSAEDTTNRWRDAVVLAADTVGDGRAEVWVGYRTGTGNFDVDVILPQPNGSFRRVADHGLRSGRVVVVPGGADTYEPVFLAGDLACCPTGGADRRRVRVEGGVWTATWLTPLPPGSPVPFSSFDTITSD
jgi:hypothetical protein